MAKLQPFPYQLEGVDLIDHFNGRALLADEVGLGKTATTLLWTKRSHAFPTVVVSPKGVKSHWQGEANQWIRTRSEVLSGRRAEHYRSRIIRPPPITIVNWDILHDWVEYLRRIGPLLIAVDEIHYAGNPKSQRSKALTALCEGIPNIIGLTGTPFVNRPIELFPILNIIRPDKFFSLPDFGWSYCNPRREYGAWNFRGAKNLDTLNSVLLDTCMIRRRKADVLDQLPEKSRFVIPIDMEDPHEYRKAADNYVAWIRRMRTKGALDKQESAKQFAELSGLKQLAARLKMPGVVEWLDNFLHDSDEKLVVFAYHKRVIRKLKERYQGVCTVIDGSVTDKNRQLAISKFRNDKKCRMMIGQIKAMGTGVDGLQVASTGVVIELPWNPGTCEQAEGRLDRIGQKNNIRMFYLISHGTVEEILCSMIDRKGWMFDEAVDGGQTFNPMNLMNSLTRAMMKGGRRAS